MEEKKNRRVKSGRLQNTRGMGMLINQAIGEALIETSGWKEGGREGRKGGAKKAQNKKGGRPHSERREGKKPKGEGVYVNGGEKRANPQGEIFYC